MFTQLSLRFEVFRFLQGRLRRPLIIAAAILCGSVTGLAQSFVHPGLLHSREDLERMKRAVAERQEPIYSGYKLFIEDPASQYTYKMQGPLEMVGRNPTVGQGVYDNDANAAHQNAIMWAITGDTVYANKAIEILNAWSSTLKSVTGRDAVLMAGLGPFKMVNAAEIIRYTNAGWKDTDIRRCEAHFKEVIYPVLKDFAPFANGNWDAAAIKTVMAIGVFCDDRAMFERGLRYYVNGCGNGRLTFYVINETGQVQETGRDQGHTQLGIGLLAEASEIAWHQGLDLYGYANNRLLKGFEYTAKYNLGGDVPFEHVLDRTGKYEHFKPSEQGRSNLRPVYEQIYDHYVNRRGLLAPFTEQAAAKLRPEGPGKPGADHPGYGTLFYSRQRLPGDRVLPSVPAVPAAIIATGSKGEIDLKWVASIGAESYVVKRAVRSGGPYRIISQSVTSPSYTDNKVKDGTVYFYTVSAKNDKGESGNAYETGISAGLPLPWDRHDIGKVTVPGTSDFDGDVFRMEGTGMGMDSARDDFHFLYQRLQGDGVITARFLPEPNSQLSEMGVTMRESMADDAPFVALLLYPGKTGQIEAPSWHARLLCRKSGGSLTSIVARGTALQAPAVTYGRLTGYYWLRLQRKGDQFSAFGSLDGRQWTLVGNTSISLTSALMVGIPLCSGMANSTIVRIDNVSVNK